MQSIQIERRLSSRSNSSQLQHEQSIPRRTMILVDLLSRINTPQHPDRQEVLHHTDRCLQNDNDICDQAQHTMERRKALMVALVDFDNEKGRDEGEQTEALDDVVQAGSSELLTHCACWLEDEGALDLEEESYGVKELY